MPIVGARRATFSTAATAATPAPVVEALPSEVSSNNCGGAGSVVSVTSVAPKGSLLRVCVMGAAEEAWPPPPHGVAGETGDASGGMPAPTASGGRAFPAASSAVADASAATVTIAAATPHGAKEGRREAAALGWA